LDQLKKLTAEVTKKTKPPDLVEADIAAVLDAIAQQKRESEAF
jgi:hypothetical protein